MVVLRVFFLGYLRMSMWLWSSLDGRASRFVSEGLEEGQFQEADERLQQTIDDYRECISAAEYYYEYDDEDVSGSAPTTVPPSPLHDGKSIGTVSRSTPLVTTTTGDTSCPPTPVRGRGIDSPRRRSTGDAGSRRRSEVYFSDPGPAGTRPLKERQKEETLRSSLENSKDEKVASNLGEPHGDDILSLISTGDA